MDRLIRTLSDRETNKQPHTENEAPFEAKKLIESGNPMGLAINSEQLFLDGNSGEIRVNTKSNNIVAQVFQYNSDKPYQVLDADKKILHVVQKNQLLLFPHIYDVVGNSEFKRAAIMQKEFREFLEKLTRKSESTAENTIEDALCVGISHLGRLFKTLEKRAGVQFTWSTEGLPKSFIDKAIKASQEASDKSGGGRKVTADDLVVICFKPSDLQRAMSKRD